MSQQRVLTDLVKGPLATILQRFDKAIVHRPRALTRRRHAQLKVSLSMLLSELYLNDPQACLVQVGALEGLQDDPLSGFLARHTLRSVLVEPQPRAYAQLLEAHRDRGHVAVCNAAVDRVDGRRTLYTVGAGPAVPSWAEGLASFDKATILKHSSLIPGLEKLVCPLDVECVSPRTLLQRYGLERIDALVIDTEGYDMEVLRAFWAAGLRPAVICLEHKHLAEGELHDGLELLIDGGYSIVHLHADVLAKRTAAAVAAVDSGSR